MQEFKSEVNGVETLKDLGMQYATTTSKTKVRMAYFKCPMCGTAFKSIYYSPAKHCKSCQNILQKSVLREKFSIAAGTTFGRLTVVSELPVQEKYKDCNRKRYNVVCACGKEFITTGTGLRRNKVTECSSCACQRRPQSTQQQTQIERMFRKVIVDRCTATNISYAITPEEYIKTATKPCHYCGAAPSNTSNYLTRHGETAIPVNGIDRVDSTTGYTLNNIVPCCAICNIMKSTLSIQDFIKHVQQIVTHLSATYSHPISKDHNDSTSS